MNTSQIQKPVFVYTRVSSLAQARQGSRDGVDPHNSHKTQYNTCARIVSQLGVGPIRGRREAIESGRDPAKQKVLEELLRNPDVTGAYVAVFDPSRLSRASAVAFEKLLERARARGVTFIACDDGFGNGSVVYDSDETLNSLRRAVSSAHDFSVRLGTRMRKGNEERLARGRELGLDVRLNSTAAYGWQISRGAEDLWVRSPHPQEQNIIEAISLMRDKNATYDKITSVLQKASGRTDLVFFNEVYSVDPKTGEEIPEKTVVYSSGVTGRVFTYVTIATELNEWGLLKRGNSWKATTVSTALHHNTPAWEQHKNAKVPVCLEDKWEDSNAEYDEFSGNALCKHCSCSFQFKYDMCACRVETTPMKRGNSWTADAVVPDSDPFLPSVTAEIAETPMSPLPPLSQHFTYDFTETAEAAAKTCALCNIQYEGYGNSGDPITSGRVCNPCNQVVLSQRLASMTDPLMTDIGSWVDLGEGVDEGGPA